MDQSKVANGGATQFGVLLVLGHLDKFCGITRQEERLQQLPAQRGRTFRLIQLLQFVQAVNQPKLPDGFAAYLFFFLAFCGSKETRVITRQHETSEDGALELCISGRGIDLFQRLPALLAPE